MTLKSLLVLVPLAGHLAAQSIPPILLGARHDGGAPVADASFSPSFRSLPAGLPCTSSFTKTVSARLSGFFVPDVVVLDSQAPMLATAPGIHQSIGVLPGPGGGPMRDVADLAVLRGAGRADGSLPSLDALVLARTDGTWIWRHDFSNGAGSLERVGGAEWNGTVLLAVHPDAPSRIFGVDATGTLRRADAGPTGYQTATTVYGSFPGAMALACVDWDGLPGAEIAVLTTSALTVLRQDGSVVFTTSATNAPDQRLTTVRGAGEWLAWLVPGATNSTLKYGRQGLLQTVALPGTFVGMTAVSMDFDAFEDLLLTTGTNNDVTLLFNQSWQNLLPFAYDPAFAVRIAVAPADQSRLANRTNVAAADFDGDGDIDLMMPIAASHLKGASFTYQGTRFFDAPAFVQVVDTHYSSDGDQESYYDLTFTSVPNTETQVLLWKETLQPNGTWTTGSIPEALPFSFLNTTSGLETVRLTLDRQHLLAGGHYSLMMRPVIRSGGSIQVVGEAFLGILYASVVTPSGDSRQRAVNDSGDGGGNLTSGDVRVGGVVGSGPIPPAPPTQPPEGEGEEPSNGGG